MEVRVPPFIGGAATSSNATSQCCFGNNDLWSDCLLEGGWSSVLGRPVAVHTIF
jgi:hypothetical protein